MFAAVTNTENMSLDSDDTRRHPYPVDYLTKYKELVPGEDDSYLHFSAELENKESNDRCFGEAEEDPLFHALDACYTQSGVSIGKERTDHRDELGSATFQEGFQWKTGGDISGRQAGMDDIREMTVTVANTHPYLTTPTQENHQLPY